MANIQVLVVDDSREFRQVLRHLFNREPGFRVVGEAENGHEAIRLTHECRPDVVLMDVAMPGLDGIQTTNKIHASLPAVKVLGLSVYEDQGFAEAMLRAGAAGYALKGGEFSQLVQKVRSTVDRSSDGEDQTPDQRPGRPAA